ncbi:MAG: hypothetical protein R3C18_15970 [Planctomycetaceae bacterium]
MNIQHIETWARGIRVVDESSEKECPTGDALQTSQFVIRAAHKLGSLFFNHNWKGAMEWLVAFSTGGPQYASIGRRLVDSVVNGEVDSSTVGPSGTAQDNVDLGFALQQLGKSDPAIQERALCTVNGLAAKLIRDDSGSGVDGLKLFYREVALAFEARIVKNRLDLSIATVSLEFLKEVVFAVSELHRVYGRPAFAAPMPSPTAVIQAVRKQKIGPLFDGRCNQALVAGSHSGSVTQHGSVDGKELNHETAEFQS